MKLDAPKNANYAAVVVRAGTLVELEGLDNLVGVPTLGHQALTTRGIEVGDLRLAFTAETQLSHEYAHENNLYRKAELNKYPHEVGYLDVNRRVRAIKLRGHTSNALLMPLSSVAWTGVDPSGLKEGDTFDHLNGHEVCRKYQIPVKVQRHQPKSKIEKAFRRVDHKLFPEHLETDQYWRNKDLLQPGREVVVTQKLHGTSIRVGRVPCLRQKGWLERLVNRVLRIITPDYEYDWVAGSRKVVKDPKSTTQQHYYASDIWTAYGEKIQELIPEGYIVYGELIGWTPDGAALQKGYTYHLPPGEAMLYVYRVSHINAQGHLSDLSWDGVKHFCQARGLKWTPELARFMTWEDDPLDGYVENFIDVRFADAAVTPDSEFVGPMEFNEAPLPLSDKKTVDEGICIRQEGLVPLILKAKSPKFLEHETRLLDRGEADIESQEVA